MSSCSKTLSSPKETGLVVRPVVTAQHVMMCLLLVFVVKQNKRGEYSMIETLTYSATNNICGGDCTDSNWYIPQSGGFYTVAGMGDLMLIRLNHTSNAVYVYCDGRSSGGSLKKPGDFTWCGRIQQLRLQSDNGGVGTIASCTF